MKSSISDKPWGEEYLIYENEDVAIWHLTIKPGKQTSLHSHPKKKTGLIVAGGAAEVCFLNSKHNLLPCQKIMIRQGVFHQSTNYLSTDLRLLEIETPVDKADLVRLSDPYGRAGKEYQPDYNKEIDLPDLHKLCVTGVCAMRVCSLGEFITEDSGLFAILEGGIYSKDGLCVAGPGDILDQNIFSLLKAKFITNPNTRGLFVRRCVLDQQ
jgi:mannose-6-phosphate isomerase-like protein (cupin superfamily)